MSIVVSPLPDGWVEAFYQSNRRHLNDPKFFENGPIWRCIGGSECPQWRRGICLSSKCIFRYPTAEDLFEHMEAPQ